MTVSASMRCLRTGSGGLLARDGGRNLAGVASRLNTSKAPSSRRGLRTRPKIVRNTTDGAASEVSAKAAKATSDAEAQVVSWDEIASKIQTSAAQHAPKPTSTKSATSKQAPTKQKPSASSSQPKASPKPEPQAQSTATGRQPKSRDYIKLGPTSLSQHWDTLPPTQPQLTYAEKYFRKKPARPFIWSAPKFHSMSFGESPEVCFLGRSNVGKSSLLNALLGGGYANVSSKPGRTKMMNAFEVGNSTDPEKNLLVLDMPGYGKGGQADWGKEIMKYLGKRKQLKRAFVLIDAEVGLKSSDEQLLAIFRKEEIPHQIVLSKVDKLLFPKNRMPSEGALESRREVLRCVFEAVRRVTQPNPEDITGALGEIIACCSERPFGQVLGINEVRHSMLQAAGLEKSLDRKLIAETEVVPHDVLFGEDH